MRIEYLEDASLERPLIRIFDFVPDEAANLKKIFKLIVAHEYAELVLTDEPGVTAIHGCRLNLRLVPSDEGVSHSPAPPHFEWRLSLQGWVTAAQMTEPFCHEPTQVGERYQWLDDIRQTRILLSPTGKW